MEPPGNQTPEKQLIAVRFCVPCIFFLDRAVCVVNAKNTIRFCFVGSGKRSTLSCVSRAALCVLNQQIIWSRNDRGLRKRSTICCRSQQIFCHLRRAKQLAFGQIRPMPSFRGLIRLSVCFWLYPASAVSEVHTRIFFLICVSLSLLIPKMSILLLTFRNLRCFSLRNTQYFRNCMLLIFKICVFYCVFQVHLVHLTPFSFSFFLSLYRFL